MNLQMIEMSHNLEACSAIMDTTKIIKDEGHISLY